MKNKIKALFKLNFVRGIGILTPFLMTGLFIIYKCSPYFDKYFIKPSAKNYGVIAINLIEIHALYASGDEWKRVKKQALNNIKYCKTYEETLPYIKDALKFAGGKHSFIMEKMSESSGKSSPSFPEISCANNILHINLPAFSGGVDDCQKYKDIIEKALLNETYKNVIIDLRENSGGDMGPMISGLSPLIEDGYLMSFVMKDSSEHKVYLKDGVVIGAGSEVKVVLRKNINVEKIAILISNQTASSGEITALAFDGINNSKIIGKKSAGFTTSNNSIKLYDGVTMIITSSKLKTRNGKILDNDPIIPHLESDSSYNDAIGWFNEN
ncbi:S41 family peptidase [Salinicoccus sp. YB14-2]|uniref:S41 family peptidase n=1 Tax=Salinicoccus sp. YB14-2 TaxID=1572701 RepID=UPI00068FE6D7|nr:S41 family peptidase [Salinicoccus sp. YB14-2]